MEGNGKATAAGSVNVETPEHTGGLWEHVGGGRIEQDGRLVALAYNAHDGTMETCASNADHIVECHNAMEGSEVRALVEAVGKMCDFLADPPNGSPRWRNLVIDLRATVKPFR